MRHCLPPLGLRQTVRSDSPTASAAGASGSQWARVDRLRSATVVALLFLGPIVTPDDLIPLALAPPRPVR